MSTDHGEQNVTMHGNPLAPRLPRGGEVAQSDELLTQEQYEAILQEHHNWLCGYGKKRPATMRPLMLDGVVCTNFAGQDLSGKDFSRADLTGANFNRAVLRKAKFVKSNLASARFVDANLAEADFVDAQGLLPDNLAGANLTNATLPESVIITARLPTVEEMSKNSGRYFLGLLAACIYVVITVQTSSDVGLFTDSNTATLPIVNIPVNTVQFFTLSPLVLLGAYVYFHLDLQRLWDTLAHMPAVFPDGRTLDETAYPWLLGNLARSYSRRLTDDEFVTNNPKPLLAWQKRLSIALGWYLAPLSIGFIWLGYIHRHHWTGTWWHVWLIIVSLVLAKVFRSLCCMTLRREFLLLGQRPLTARAPRFPAQAIRDAKQLRESWHVTTARWRQLADQDFLVARLVLRERHTLPWLTAMIVLALTLRGSTVNLMRAIPEGDLLLSHKADRDPGLAWLNRLVPRNAISDDPRIAWASLVKHVYRPFARLEGANVVPRPTNWTGVKDVDFEQIPVLQFHDKFLRYAEMNGAFLVRADMTGSTLNGAQLRSADLRHANLHTYHESIPEGPWNPRFGLRADLEKARLDYADLTGADMEGVNLRSANLYYAKLDYSVMKNGHLNGAYLKNATLTHAILTGADLTEADLTRADLLGARLNAAQFRKAKFVGAILIDTDLTWAKLDDTDLRGAKLGGERLQHASLDNANLNGAVLGNADMTAANVQNANLMNADLSYATLDAADLSGADLTSAFLNGASASKAHFTGTQLPDAHLTGANLSGAKLNAAKLKGADFTDANLSGADFTNADLTGANLTRTDLTGADLRSAIGLTQPQLRSAITNAKTRVSKPLIAASVQAH